MAIKLTNQSMIGRDVVTQNDNDTASALPHRSGDKMKAPDGFDGPTDKRSYTDILFGILIVLMWGAMTGIGIYAFQKGDYRLVLYPLDYDGNICGTDFGEIDMTEYPLLVYVNSLGGGVCVKECPKVESLIDPRTLITYDGVYQGENATLSPDFISIADYTNATIRTTCDETNCTTDPSASWTSPGIRGGYGYAFYAVDTFEVLGTRCFANPLALDRMKEIIDIPDSSILNIESVDAGLDFWNNLYGDIFSARLHILLFGLGIAVALGLLYTFLLRVKFLLGFLVWMSIFTTIGFIFGVAGFALYSAQQWDKAEPQLYADGTISATKIFSYVAFGIGGILILLIIFLRKEIQLAMACVKEASRAIGRMPIIMFFPVLQVFGFVAFMVLWVFYAVNLASMGDIETYNLPFDSPVSMRSYEFSTFVRRCGWYLLFCFFWTIGFIVSMGDIILSMSVAKWYFTRNKKSVGNCTLCGSICTSIRYHMGTAAFGSLILAVVQIIRAFVINLQRKAQQMDNKIGQAILCCLQCILWCFQKFIEFLNKNAYIQTAIFGTSFCRSAAAAFSLVLRNAKRIGSISYVSHIVIFVGKLFICIVTTGSAYIYMEKDLGNTVDSIIGPAVMVLFISYFIADTFLDVFEMTTSTILHCFIADEEMFDGDDCYAENELRKWLDEFEEEERKTIKV